MILSEKRIKNAAAMRAWRAANPEKAREIKKRSDAVRYARHKERIKAKARKYHNDNKELIAERRRKQNAADPSKNRARVLAWQKANPDKARARHKRWYWSNPENKDKIRVHVIQRRARLRGIEGKFTIADIENLKIKQSGKCANERCGTLLIESCSVDHIVPLIAGGTNWPDNLQLLCGRCNSSKGVKPMESWIGSV